MNQRKNTPLSRKPRDHRPDILALRTTEAVIVGVTNGLPEARPVATAAIQHLAELLLPHPVGAVLNQHRVVDLARNACFTLQIRQDRGLLGSFLFIRLP